MPNKRIVFFLVIALGGSLYFSCSESTGLKDADGLRERIGNLEGVNVIELVPYYGFEREFLLEIEQPVNHQDSAGETFIQLAYLLHNSESGPVVLGANGYAAFVDDLCEMTMALNANQISVTHRYFAGAVPGSEDYQYLTMEQAAADLHRIVELFKEIYPENWLNSGFGKGGLTALAHRRYYPDDVAATISYSTPFLNGQNDSRPIEYMNTLGDDSTRAKIKMFQEALLKRRSEIIPYIYYYMDYTGYYYYYRWSRSADLILELAVLSYPFEYWSASNQDISGIPDTSETAETLFKHLNEVIWLDLFSDNYIEYLQPARYQSMTELGAPTYETDHIRDLLTVVNPDDSVNYYYEILAPADVELNYDSGVLTDLQEWLQSEGNNIIYLYGELDPITATAIDLSGNSTNAIKLIQTGLDHYIGIEQFDDADAVYNALGDWMGFEIEPLTKIVHPATTERLRKPVFK